MRRSRLSITLEVLKYVAEEGPVPATRVAQATGLAYDRLSSLLEDLSERGLVQIDASERSRRVSITKKGLSVLSRLLELKDLLEDLGLDV